MNKKYLIILSLFLVLIISLVLTHSYIGRYIIKEKSAEEESSDIERLISLPYLSGVTEDPAPEKMGVTLYNRDLSYRGINVFTPYAMKETHLMDMMGEILHTWSSDTPHGWQYSELDNESNLFVIEGEYAHTFKTLVKLDWDSNVQWVSKNNHHHDFAFSSSGDMYVLTKGKRYVSFMSQEIPIRDNTITVLTPDPDGKVKSSISIYDLLASEGMLPKRILAGVKKRYSRSRRNKKINKGIKHGFDVFHTNTIEVIERDIGVANKGNILIFINKIDLAAIVDIEREKVIWTWGPGIVNRAHMPTVLENGNILILDNGRSRRYSRVIELNPITKKIEWEYKSDPPELFHSRFRGSAQKLPNNNVLITECDRGRVFEITRDGEIVWEFYNPKRDKKKDKRVAIYRMMRITDPENYPKLKGLQ
ncbi:hypothetical protein ES707_17662 [subsurface metagenome]